MADLWQDLSRPPLRQTALRRALVEGPDPAWRHLDVVARTGSTNADLAARAADGEPEGAVLVADHQSAGRGRRGRTWEAPPRAGLAVSVLLRPQGRGVPPERWAWLGLMAGVAVTDALVRTCGLPATLKWPNDVLVPRPDGAGPGKVAGLIAEVVRRNPESRGDGEGSGPAVVLGLGLNVSQDVAELPVPTATSLKLAGSATTDRDTVLRAVLRALAERYRDLGGAGPRGGHAAGVARLAAVYRERCATIGQRVRVELPDGTALTGTADGVDDEGRLLVVPDGSGPGPVAPLALSAGDVVHLRPLPPD